jgi:hypothetical protein
VDYQTSQGPTPNEMRLVSDGASSAAMLPTMQREMEAIVKGVQNRVLGHLRQNTLTPDMALDAWREIEMATRFVKSIQSRAAVGKATAETLTLEL